MRKVYIIIASLFLLATPVLASGVDEGQGKGGPEDVKGVSTVSEQTNTSSTLSAQGTCEIAKNWKNHGEYVSCVAHLHQGGQVTSEAARSDIGKKEDTGKNEDKLETSKSTTTISDNTEKLVKNKYQKGNIITINEATVSTKLNRRKSQGLTSRLESLINYLNKNYYFTQYS